MFFRWAGGATIEAALYVSPGAERAFDWSSRSVSRQAGGPLMAQRAGVTKRPRNYNDATYLAAGE